MNWYWKVRIYRPDGQYAHAEIKTERTTKDIDTIQDFYQDLTKCRMLLEGMSEVSFNIENISSAFASLWSSK